MPILLQIAILFAICVAGTAVSVILPFPFPSSVAAMLLLFILLLFKILRPAQLKDITQFLQKNMAVLFVPAAVGVLNYFDLLKPFLLQMLLIGLVTTVLTFAVTQFTVRFIIRLQTGKGGHTNGTSTRDNT